MNDNSIQITSYKDMTHQEFNAVASFIEKKAGIKMPESKKIMMQSRLTSRLRALGIPTYKEYIEYVFEKDTAGQEVVHMIDVLTTNKTEFFREKDHFTFLTGTVLPELSKRGKKNIKIWCAGCSTGEEAYTLSIVMHEFMRANPGSLSDFSVAASDISTKVLSKAVNAVYTAESIQSLSFEMKKRYFLKSANAHESSVRVKPFIREKVSFTRLNFIEDSFAFKHKFSIIFCRNVLIYFDKKTQENVISKFTEQLDTGGYLFLGHSETILTKTGPLKNAAPTVYKNTGEYGT